MVTESSHSQLTRRSFLIHSTQALIGLATISVPDLCLAKIPEKRTLSLYHARAQKALTLTYANGKQYNPKALARINSFLRDYQTGQVHRIDPKLLDILWAVQREIGSKGVFKVVSAFRSPQTNRQLRRAKSGVASHSLHMEGRAVDIQFSGADLGQIRRCAMDLQTGGVGFYPKSNFVHLDSGDYRTW
jgi:uncharacterized protein YcbK (DUF882 family)